MKFSGSLVPIVTPFRDGELDRDGLERLVTHMLDAGSNGIIPCGTTGESATLSHDEHETVIRWTVEIVAGRVPVLAGTGSNNTAEAVALTKSAQEIGADGSLLISPYYNKPTQEGIVRHYEAIATACSDFPLIAYNVPGRTSSKMGVETVARLSRIDNVIGIKEACGSIEQVQEVMELATEGFAVFSGEDALNFPILALGGAGLISAVANVAPKALADLSRHALNGEWEEARALHFRLLPLVRACFAETNPIPVKTGCAILGICSDEMRLPMTPMTSPNRRRLEEAMETFGLAAA